MEDKENMEGIKMKREKIAVPIGKKMLFLVERAAENKDKESLKTISNIAHELLTTSEVISSDDISFVDIMDYSSMISEALDNGVSIEKIKQSSYAKDLAKRKEL